MFNLTDFIFKLFTQLPLILVSHAASLFLHIISYPFK